MCVVLLLPFAMETYRMRHVREAAGNVTQYNNTSTRRRKHIQRIEHSASPLCRSHENRFEYLTVSSSSRDVPTTTVSTRVFYAARRRRQQSKGVRQTNKKTRPRVQIKYTRGKIFPPSSNSRYRNVTCCVLRITIYRTLSETLQVKFMYTFFFFFFTTRILFDV